MSVRDIHLLHDQVLAAADVLSRGAYDSPQEVQVCGAAAARLYAVHEMRRHLVVTLVSA